MLVPLYSNCSVEFYRKFSTTKFEGISTQYRRTIPKSSNSSFQRSYHLLHIEILLSSTRAVLAERSHQEFRTRPSLGEAMEIASPLAFASPRGGAKRPYALSSALLETTEGIGNDNASPCSMVHVELYDSQGFSTQPSKRRRRHSGDRNDTSSAALHTVTGTPQPISSNMPSYDRSFLTSVAAPRVSLKGKLARLAVALSCSFSNSFEYCHWRRIAVTSDFFYEIRVYDYIYVVLMQCRRHSFRKLSSFLFVPGDYLLGSDLLCLLIYLSKGSSRNS